MLTDYFFAGWSRFSNAALPIFRICPGLPHPSQPTISAPTYRFASDPAYRFRLIFRFRHEADRKATQLSCCNAISVIKDLSLEYLWQGILITDTHWRASVNKGYRYRVL